MADGRKEYTFLWFIKNYSYCWHNNVERLSSPVFSPFGLEGTSWNIRLYPRGNIEERKSKISLFLARSVNDDGPQTFPLNFELSFIAVDGSPLMSIEKEKAFKMDSAYRETDFLSVDDVLKGRRSEYLPEDILSVRCKMWKKEGDIQKAAQVSARTLIGIEKISFLLKVENFSALKPNEKKTIHIRPQSKTGCNISCSLYFTERSFSDKKIFVEIVPSDRNYILRKLKISLLTVSKSVIECGEVDNRFDAIGKEIQNLPLSLTRDIILNNKGEYLPNDELCLITDCSFSTGIEFQKIVEIQHELPMVALKQSCKNISYIAAEKLSACNSVAEDMKAIYINQCLTDVVLKTNTKTFPAHKIVLCARSSVFKAMLTNDMREKITDCIQVDDLENDIVQQLLLFLYSDNLENLQWESAIKLYYSGDKYAVEKLKVLCSSFLTDNLNISTASQLLLLADTHNDSNLKNFVENFILKYIEQIIDSDEWNNLEQTYPELAMTTMHLMIKGKEGGK